MVLELIVFFFFAVVAVAFALMVVLHRNPVVNAVALVVTFFALAVMYVLLEAPFMAALQVIVYAGAIMVLFLFTIMLLNLQREQERGARPIQRFLGFFGGTAFGLTIAYYTVKATVIDMGPEAPFLSDARAIGFRMFEAYILPFEMVSILLLAAIVGALLLTQRDVRKHDVRTAIAETLAQDAAQPGVDIPSGSEGPGREGAENLAHPATRIPHLTARDDNAAVGGPR